MAIILSIYSSILALALWQEEHGRDEAEQTKAGHHGGCC